MGSRPRIVFVSLLLLFVILLGYWALVIMSEAEKQMESEEEGLVDFICSGKMWWGDAILLCLLPVALMVALSIRWRIQSGVWIWTDLEDAISELESKEGAKSLEEDESNA